MGVAGVAMLGMIISFFRGIYFTVLYLIWKNKVDTNGVVRELKDSKINYKKNSADKINSIEYTYVVEVYNDNKKYLCDYTEVVSGKSQKKLENNESLQVFFDPKKNEIKSKKAIKHEIIQCILAFFMCIGILVLCFVLVEYLGNLRN